MKVKDLDNSLGLMVGLIEKLQNNQQLTDLIGYYDFVKKNSGYYFSDFDPSDFRTKLEEMLGDIERIKEDMQSCIQTHGQDLEL